MSLIDPRSGLGTIFKAMGVGGSGGANTDKNGITKGINIIVIFLLVMMASCGSVFVIGK